VLAIGGQVDAVHAASLLLLAAVSRAGRRAALTDALTEAAFAWVSCTRATAGAGFLCLGSADPDRELPIGTGTAGSLVDRGR
jgi:hypothetical protein